jgi:CPA2 family monovalent cation:H+ antiporter-2
MLSHGLLPGLVLTYAVALLFIVVLARLRVPHIVALITAGAVAGPSVLGLIGTQEEVNTLAEIGIVLLLFTVGLDFSLSEIRRIWKIVVGGGTLQIAGTAAVFLLMLTPAFGSWRASLFIGFFVALSSTAIVLQELSARNQLDAPHGRLMVGILLFQDLCIVALLLLVPILAGKTPVSAVPLVILRTTVVIGTVAAVSRVVLPALLGIVSRSGRPEAFPLAVVLASIGTAWISSLFGLSMALGAFLGGLVLAESEFSHQAFAEIRPLRDILAGLFFISLGMLVDLSLVLNMLPYVAFVTILIIVVKAIVAGAALWALATPLRVAATAGIGLAQVGEFSFILGRSGLDLGLLTSDQWQVLLAASIGTMLVTPTLLAFAPRIGSWLGSRQKGLPAADLFAGAEQLSDHVVIVGFGVGGQLVARALRDIGVPYLILELNGATVREGRREGEMIFFGDATSPDALRGAGLARARAVVALLSDPHATLHLVKAVRQLAPPLPVIVRTRYRAEADYLARMGGATVAVAEELEASLEVLAQLLARLDVPGNAIEVLLEGFRKGTAVRSVRAPSRPLEALPPEIGQAPISSHQVQKGDWAIGKTVAELNLRATTGALIIAVRQGTRHRASPPADLQVNDGDVLYLLGDDSDIMLAQRRVMTGE